MKREDLIQVIQRDFLKINFDTEKRNKLANYCRDNYDVPLGHVMDIISGRCLLSEENNDMLFFLADSLDNICFSKYISTYFTEDEIKLYKDKKYELLELKHFPINCVEVEENKQWIGVTDVQFLMKLRKAGKIRYNIQKQRTRKVVVKGDQIFYKINIIKKSVNQIGKLMKDGEYIPDDITLDIPDDVSSNFTFYKDRSTLLIEYIDTFDITDGYHRYLAMCKLFDENPDFNYPVELRITNFPISRTQQFAFQKDQKNKMTASNSKSMDTNRTSNLVVDYMNARGNGFNMAGQIARGREYIDYAALSDNIEYYFIDSKVTYERQNIKEIADRVTPYFNAFVNRYPEFFSAHMGYKEISLLFYLMMNKKENPTEAGATLKKCIANKEINKIRTQSMRKTLFNQIETIDFDK